MKSVFTYGIRPVPFGGRERPAPEPGAPEAAVGDRVRATGRSGSRCRAGPATGCSQIVDAVADAADRLVGDRGAADEQHEPDRDVQRASGGDVEHREEDPEVEERAAEVVRLDEDEHRRAPDREQRPEVLQAPLREHLPLLAQVAGEEDDQRDLRQLARLELERADLHPEPGAVDRRRRGRAAPAASAAPTARDPEEVLVALEHAEVVAQQDEREREAPTPTTIQKPCRNASVGPRR